MAVLEHMGLLMHPHTSAGRVPTDHGYRAYVDTSLKIEPLPASARQAIRRRIGEAADEPEEATDEAARLLASLTQYPSVVAEPGLPQQTFQSLHLVSLGEDRALAVIATTAGSLQGRPIRLPPGTATEDLEDLSRAITRRLQGARIGDLTTQRLEDALSEVTRHHQLLEAIRGWLHRDLARGGRPRIHVEGTSHLLRQPEFSRPEEATRILEALEEQTTLVEALASAPGDGMWVSIGAENRPAGLQSCSLVMAAYRTGDHVGGMVGIVGPTRMRYRHAVAAVQYVADRLSEALGAVR
jgi:heat-inducible transcriptional repressor